MNAFFRRAERACLKISRVLLYCAAVSVVCMMLLICADVLLRAILNKPILGSYEVAQYLLCICVYGGFAFCQCRQGHMHVTMFLYKMKRVPCFLIWSFASLVSAGMGVALAIACWIQSFTVQAQGMKSILLGIPQAPLQFFAGICMLAFAFALLLDGIKAVAALFSDEYAKEIRSHWVG